MNRIVILLIGLSLLTQCKKHETMTELKVYPSEIIHTMKGGIGASWHAISRDLPLENEKYLFKAREICPRGSAFGGNPPVSDSLLWNSIKEHASWLGLNFIRVELSHDMYEPERKIFDWDNEEMQALYQILDWCQESNADVFLQQMWGNVKWNSYPDVNPLISAPKSLDDFAYGIATLIEYLTEIKGYSCIKYFCMTNEPPGGPWGYWWEYGNQNGSINDAWKRLKEEFDARNIRIPISGPDWTSMPPFEEEKLVFAPWLGSFDIHSYEGVTPEGEANLKQWADFAHAQNKPFFLTEFGNMKLGWGTDNPGPKSFEASISNANDIIRALRAGTDGANRWSFTNRGDLDGQWQLIQTFDREKKEYLADAKTEPEAYFGFGIISRFLSKYSSTVQIQCSCSDSLLLPIALVSPAGELSIFILNPSETEVNLRLSIDKYPGKTMNLYQLTKETVTQAGFELNSIHTFKSSGTEKLVLPARSITTVSSYSLSGDEKGIILQ